MRTRTIIASILASLFLALPAMAAVQTPAAKKGDGGQAVGTVTSVAPRPGGDGVLVVFEGLPAAFALTTATVVRDLGNLGAVADARVMSAALKGKRVLISWRWGADGGLELVSMEQTAENLVPAAVVRLETVTAAKPLDKDRGLKRAGNAATTKKTSK